MTGDEDQNVPQTLAFQQKSRIDKKTGPNWGGQEPRMRKPLENHSWLWVFEPETRPIQAEQS